MRRSKPVEKVKVPHGIWASVTERGQVTIPAEVRKTLGISKKSKIIFRLDGDSVVLKKPRYSSVAELFADSPSVTLKEPKTWEEIKQTVQDEVAEDFRREMHEGRT
jgi:AbrB family looped-hinge helix DNA binding protein